MLWTDHDDAIAEAANNSGRDFPTTPEDLFHAAWARNDFLMQGLTGESDRLDALGDYHRRIKQETGVDLAPELDYGTFGGGMMPNASALFAQTNAKLAEFNEKNPDRKFEPMSAEDFEQNALNKRRQADADYEAVKARPRVPYATAGLALGAGAAQGVSPINILALPVAPAEGIGVLAKAAQWGLIGLGTGAVQEAFAAPYQEEVQPGYIASGAPLLNVAASGAELAAAGPIAAGVAKVASFVSEPLIRRLAKMWEGAAVRTAWPDSVKQAGDVVTSQANLIGTNVYPGPDGELAHEQALPKAIDDIFAGRPVDVSQHITPELDARAGVTPIEEARTQAQAATAEAERMLAKARAEEAARAPELPFARTAAEAEAEGRRQILSEGVQRMTRRNGYDMPAEDAARVADKLAQASPEQAQDLLRNLQISPRQVAEAPLREEIPPKEIPTPVSRLDASAPDFHAAQRADLDRELEARQAAPPAAEQYVSQAVRNLNISSRTATGHGIVIAPGTEAKEAALVVGEKTPEQLAQLAQGNFERTIRSLYAERDAIPTTGPAMEKKIDDVAASINKGIVKPSALDRAHETKFANQTAVADLAAAKKQFAEEFATRLADPNADPVETAAWVEWRANLMDHFWSDGTGRTAKALAAIPLMRAGLPLPETLPTRMHASFVPSEPGAYTGAEWQKYNEFYHTLAGVQTDATKGAFELGMPPLEIARAQEALARGAAPEEIERMPIIERAKQAARALEHTEKRPGYLTDKYKAEREFDFNGERVIGWNNAVDRLTDKATSYSPEGIANERRAVIVTGPGGAGKSSQVMEPLAQKLKGAIVDADDAKPVMPEYRGGIGADAVHDESTALEYEPGGVLDRLMDQKANVVIGKIGHTAESIRDLQSLLKNGGYQVDLIDVDEIGPEIAYRRRLGRFLATGRINPEDYEKSLPRFYNSKENYPIYKTEGLFHEQVALDVSGQPPPRVTDGGHTDLAGTLGLRPGRGRVEGLEAAVRGPAPTAEPIRSAIPQSVEAFTPESLKVDAKRFQFKEGGDEAGVTDRLKGVTQWDAVKAGMALVWRDKAGQDFIVDGHQRLALAQRIKAADPAQNPQLLAHVLKESDGVSDSDARVMAAMKNIAEGTGSAIDAAKVLRDNPERAGELPPRSELYRQAQGLANLDNDAFRMVVNGVVPPNYGAIVGRLTPDPQLQSSLLSLLHKTEPANITQAEAIVRQGIAAGTAKAEAGAQGALFGDQEIAENLFLDRAKVLDRALKDLKKDKTVFKTLSKEQQTIEAAGNKLAAEINEKRATQDAQAIQVLQILASRTGPVSTALGDAAQRLRAGARPGDAARGFVAEIRSLVESGDLARLANGIERGPTHLGDEAASRVVDRAAAEPVKPAEEAEATQEIKTMFEPGAEGLPQGVMPGMAPSARQLAAAREGALRPGVAQERPGGLFAPAEEARPDMFPNIAADGKPISLERALSEVDGYKAAAEQLAACAAPAEAGAPA